MADVSIGDVTVSLSGCSAAPVAAGDGTLASFLLADGYSIAAKLVVGPAGPGGRPPDADSGVTLAVPVEAGQGAMVIVESPDGSLLWQGPAVGRAGRQAGARVVHFTVPVHRGGDGPVDPAFTLWIVRFPEDGRNRDRIARIDLAPRMGTDASPRGPAGTPRRQESQGRSSFSHGRSNTVIVETKRRGAQGRAAASRRPPSARHGMAGIGGARSAPETDTARVVSAPAVPATVRRQVAAEMEPRPKLPGAANLYVTVSPDAVGIAAHAAAARGSVEVDPGRPIALHVIARQNCEVVGRDTAEVDPGAPAEVVTRFQLRGLAAGRAEVLVEARQGTQTLVSLLLAPEFVTDAPLREVQPMAVLPPPPPDRAVLRIYEFKALDGTTLRFDFATEGGVGLLETVRLPVDFDLKRYAVETLKEVEDAWNLRGEGGADVIYRSFLRRLSNKARDRTARLIPESIRSALWKNRAQIRTIQVISEVSYIPWELLYLSDPDGNENDGEGFFAERGLMRWLHNAPQRRLPPKLDGATSRYVVPDYRSADAVLPGAAAERAMLEARLPGITAVPATSSDVCDFLARGAKDCSLLHFACHGETAQRSEVESMLLMTEQKRADGALLLDPLTWQDVKAEVDFGTGHAPLVFVNACQTGQGGTGITGSAGFADAFIRPRSNRGASMFIGALWSVDDRLATRFADTTYRELAAGKPLADAVQAAREACKANHDFTWLAYSVYCFA